MTEYYYILHLIYYDFADSYTSFSQSEKDLDEKEVIKNQVIHDKVYKKKLDSTFVEKDLIDSIAWEMRDIYSGYSQNKEVRLDMDGQYLTREITFSPGFQQNLSKGDVNAENLSKLFKQAIDDATAQIAAATLLSLGDSHKLLAKDYLQLIVNHFKYRDLWQQIDEVNKDRFAPDIEKIDELENSHCMNIFEQSQKLS